MRWLRIRHDQSITRSIETQRPSDPPDGRRCVFSDRSDFPVGGASAAAAYYGAELDEKIREWVGTLNRCASLVLLLVPWLILEPIKPVGFLLLLHPAATALPK